MPTILIADDDDAIRTMLRAVLERAGHEVMEADNGRVALRSVHEARPDLVMLDVEMPDLDGWDTLERLRDVTDAPVIMLTAHASERDKVRGLSAGADDYVTKPFGREELLARVTAVLRRARPAAAPMPGSGSHRLFGDLEVHPDRREVRVAGRPVALTKIEFDVLDALTASPSRVLDRRQLLEHVWGPSWFGDEGTIDVHVSKLRRKLGDDPRAPRYIETVRGVGFRMAASLKEPFRKALE